MNALLQPASERLVHSREQLRQALHKLPGATPNPSSAASPATNGAAARAPQSAPWLDEIKRSPGVAILIDVVSHWWAQHPLRVAATLASSGANAALKPLAQRHPVALVAGAAVLGGLLAWCRPWRWPRQALWAGLMPQLALAAVRAVSAQPGPRRPP